MYYGGITISLENAFTCGNPRKIKGQYKKGEVNTLCWRYEKARGVLGFKEVRGGKELLMSYRERNSCRGKICSLTSHRYAKSRVSPMRGRG